MSEEMLVRITGNDLSVKVEWEGDGGTYSKRIPPVVEPTPDPEPEPILPAEVMAHLGAWKYISQPPGAFREFMADMNVTWGKYTTLGYTNNPNLRPDRGFPAIVTLGPSNDSDEKVKANLTRCYEEREYGTWGIHVWDEKGWSAKAQMWYDWIRANCPDWLIVSGPIPWTYWPAYNKLDICDVILSYQNVTRPGRKEADIGFHRMMAAAYGKPLIFSVNPVDYTPTGKPWTLADPDKYIDGLSWSAVLADATIIWRLEEFQKVLQGTASLTNPEAAEPIMAAIRGWTPLNNTRPKVNVYVPSDEEGAFHHYHVKAAARVALYADLDPVANKNVGISTMQLCEKTGIPWAAYSDLSSRFNDQGRWTPEIERQLDEMEYRMADALREEA